MKYVESKYSYSRRLEVYRRLTIEGGGWWALDPMLILIIQVSLHSAWFLSKLSSFLRGFRENHSSSLMVEHSKLELVLSKEILDEKKSTNIHITKKILIKVA